MSCKISVPGDFNSMNNTDATILLSKCRWHYFLLLCVLMRTKNPEEAVRRYYDRNTRRFLRLSRRSAPKVIHQPLYTTEDMSLEAALHTQHKEILEMLPSSPTPCTILDLGCGVGESMLYLAHHTSHDFKYTGITLSGEQVALGSGIISTSRHRDRIQICQGSFQSLPVPPGSVDLAYAIESFIHADDVSGFFTQVTSVLKPGGQLVIFDDFISGIPKPRDQLVLSDLKTGWLAHTLLTIKEVESNAAKHGLTLQSARDFSHTLKQNRLRDRLVHWITPLARPFVQHSQYCRFLIGGDARQRAYQADILGYYKLVFAKK